MRSALLLLLGCGQFPALWAQPPTFVQPVQFDRTLIVPHTDSLRIVVDGVPMGSLVRHYFVEDLDGRPTLQVRSVTKLGGTVTTTLVLQSDNLEVRSVVSQGDRGGRPVDVRLTYAGDGIVVGPVGVPSRAGARWTFVVDTVLSPGEIDDNAVQALVVAMVVQIGQTYSIGPFDASTNQVVRYQFRVSNGGMQTVPAGTFSTILLDRTGGPAPMKIYLSKQVPRRIVRINFVGIPVVMELVR